MQEFTASLPLYKEPSKRLKSFVEDFIQEPQYLAQFVKDRIKFIPNGISSNNIKKISKSTSIMVSSLKNPISESLDFAVICNFLTKFNIMSAMAVSAKSDCTFILELSENVDLYPNACKVLHVTFKTENTVLSSTIDNLFRALD